MSIVIELTSQEIAGIKRATSIDNEAEAVTVAAREFLRLMGLRELKTVSGKVDFSSNWQQLEEFELNELSVPQE